MLLKGYEDAHHNIFTHPNYRKVVKARYKAIDDAFDRSAASPLLQHVLNEDVASFS